MLYLILIFLSIPILRGIFYFLFIYFFCYGIFINNNIIVVNLTTGER